jgi:hypothetical protein
MNRAVWEWKPENLTGEERIWRAWREFVGGKEGNKGVVSFGSVLPLQRLTLWALRPVHRGAPG